MQRGYSCHPKVMLPGPQDVLDDAHSSLIVRVYTQTHYVVHKFSPFLKLNNSCRVGRQHHEVPKAIGIGSYYPFRMNIASG